MKIFIKIPKMKYFPSIFLVAALFTFLSCDCQIGISGKVIDYDSGLPLDSVAIGKTDTSDLENPFNEKVYTDANGDFDFHGIAGKCNVVLLYFSRDGYNTSAIEYENFSSDTIRLKKK
ncbi:MAG: carboxypeptidase regulatory-like domain-containing protein [Bacteroidales bacterium]|nr:carboxypeptidase regulatory-like domain-containing protein [Bacteroidales bacterium]